MNSSIVGGIWNGTCKIPWFQITHDQLRDFNHSKLLSLAPTYLDSALGCPGTDVRILMVSKCVITYLQMECIGVITCLLTIDPNFLGHPSTSCGLINPVATSQCLPTRQQQHYHQTLALHRRTWLATRRLWHWKATLWSKSLTYLEDWLPVSR